MCLSNFQTPKTPPSYGLATN